MKKDRSAWSQASTATTAVSGGTTNTPAAYRICISGTTGQSFQGRLKITATDGQATEREVQGPVPWELSVSGRRVELGLHSRGTSGTLRVEIFRDGRLVSASTLSGQGGSVTAAA